MQEYAYAENGNRASLTETTPQGIEILTEYEYDINDRLLTEATGGNTKTYAYDQNGNMLSKTDGTETHTQAFDLLNRMISYTDGTTEAAYAYTPDNLRRSKTVDGDTTEYIWIGSNIVLDITDNDVVSYVRGLRLIHSGHGWHIYDAHGSVVQLTDDDGEITRQYDYDPFGVERGDGDDTDKNPFRYSGEYTDFESGYVYLRARYYDPAVGRFVSEDPYWNPGNMVYGSNPVKWNEREADPNNPLGINTYIFMPDIFAISQSGNLYVYGMNNPVLFIDPSGKFALSAVLMTALGLTFLAVLLFAMSNDPNFHSAVNTAITQIANDISRAADRLGRTFNSIAESLKELAGTSGGSPNSDQEPNRSLKQIKGNKEANRVAQRNGYKNAEALKNEYAPGNASKFNIFRDTNSNELVLKSIRGNIQIPTGLFG